MKACWIDAGNDPDYAKLAEYGITWPYFDPRDPRVTAAYLDDVKAHPGIDGCGLYFAWNWWPQLDGPGFVGRAHLELLRIGWQGNVSVCLDIESHAIRDYLVPAIKHWRTLRPTRTTDLTLEGFQGGLFTPPDVLAITAAKVGVAPQFYAGDMTPLGHSPMIDLMIAGFPSDRLIGMYDAARLPYSAAWRGYAFSQGRLPT